MRSSTPLMNFIGRGLPPELQQKHQDWVLGYYRFNPPPPYAQLDGERSVAYAKRILGPQTRCKMVMWDRYWIWEGDLWTVMVSKRGLQLEVVIPDTFRWNDHAGHTALAIRALEAFLTHWQRPQEVPQ